MLARAPQPAAGITITIRFAPYSSHQITVARETLEQHEPAWVNGFDVATNGSGLEVFVQDAHPADSQAQLEKTTDSHVTVSSGGAVTPF